MAVNRAPLAVLTGVFPRYLLDAGSEVRFGSTSHAVGTMRDELRPSTGAQRTRRAKRVLFRRRISGPHHSGFKQLLALGAAKTENLL